MTAPSITAHPVGPTDGWSIESASPKRDWMDKLHNGFPYRCLPLLIANQLGWVVRCPIAAECIWSGGPHPSDLAVTVADDTDPHQRTMIASHFGGGILTISLPWLFTTDPRHALHVSGVPNRPTPGMHPLEGVVETAWSPYTFTMNYKLTDPGRPVFIDPGDPVCLIRPVSIAHLESASIAQRPIETNPELKANFETWRQQRLDFNANPERLPKDWQKNYYRGKLPDGSKPADASHHPKLNLQPPSP